MAQMNFNSGGKKAPAPTRPTTAAALTKSNAAAANRYAAQAAAYKNRSQNADAGRYQAAANAAKNNAANQARAARQSETGNWSDDVTRRATAAAASAGDPRNNPAYWRNPQQQGPNSNWFTDNIVRPIAGWFNQNQPPLFNLNNTWYEPGRVPTGLTRGQQADANRYQEYFNQSVGGRSNAAWAERYRTAATNEWVRRTRANRAWTNRLTDQAIEYLSRDIPPIDEGAGPVDYGSGGGYDYGYPDYGPGDYTPPKNVDEFWANMVNWRIRTPQGG